MKGGLRKSEITALGPLPIGTNTGINMALTAGLTTHPAILISAASLRACCPWRVYNFAWETGRAVRGGWNQP